MITHSNGVELAETLIPVQDLEESLGIYHEALGLDLVEQHKNHALLKDARTGQALCLKRTEVRKRPSLTLRTHNFEQTLKRLKLSGAQEVDREVGESFKCATFKDHDGHEIFFWWAKDAKRP